MGRRIDIAGFRFGRLVVVRYAGPDVGGRSTWECICDCGGSRIASGINLRAGRVASCGCLQTEARKVALLTHGLSTGREYRAWQKMKSRCSNPKHPSFPNYGGRGISVCEAWASFLQFYEDMGPAPEGATLDRIDNELGYEPGNCRWASHEIQARNRRHRLGKSRFTGVYLRHDGRWYAQIMVSGKVKCLGSFAREEDAARARDAEAVKHPGFNLNFRQG